MQGGNLNAMAKALSVFPFPCHAGGQPNVGISRREPQAKRSAACRVGQQFEATVLISSP